jgi:hypothetical protein
VPVFPKLFFPAGDATSALLQLRDHSGALVRGTMMALDLALMGHTYGPLNAVLDDPPQCAIRELRSPSTWPAFSAPPWRLISQPGDPLRPALLMLLALWDVRETMHDDM